MKDYKKNKTVPALLKRVSFQCQKPIVENELNGLISHIKNKFSNSLSGIILYGSCLHENNLKKGVVDLYVIVNNYKDAYGNTPLRTLNFLLPPNIFYFESLGTENKIRSKYAVISLEDFQQGAERWFHSYIWSRFSQPVKLLYSRDNATEAYLHSLFVQSVIMFFKKTAPVLGPGVFSAEAIWTNGLTLTYSAELRPELQNRAAYIIHQAGDDLIGLIQDATPRLPGLLQQLPSGEYKINVTNAGRRYALLQWKLRRWQGRLFSIIRLIKAVFTFKDCVDYAAWKIERHTGVTIDVTPRLKKHPILFGFNILCKLLKKNTLHW